MPLDRLVHGETGPVQDIAHCSQGIGLRRALLVVSSTSAGISREANRGSARIGRSVRSMSCLKRPAPFGAHHAAVPGALAVARHLSLCVQAVDGECPAPERRVFRLGLDGQDPSGGKALQEEQRRRADVRAEVDDAASPIA
jgi:hypothetical protein